MSEKDKTNALWNIEDVAKYLGVAEVTARIYYYKHEMPFIKLGAAVRFRKCDIDDWVAKRKSVYKNTDNIKEIIDNM